MVRVGDSDAAVPPVDPGAPHGGRGAAHRGGGRRADLGIIQHRCEAVGAEPGRGQLRTCARCCQPVRPATAVLLPVQASQRPSPHLARRLWTPRPRLCTPPMATATSGPVAVQRSNVCDHRALRPWGLPRIEAPSREAMNRSGCRTLVAIVLGLGLPAATGSRWYRASLPVVQRSSCRFGHADMLPRGADLAAKVWVYAAP